MRPEDERYFRRLEDQLDDAFDVAERAKERGGDPKPEVEIPVAKDMADRVENILGIDGVAERVRELEGQMSREEAALELAADFAEGRVGDYETRAGKVEGAVRTAVALLTEGVVAARSRGSTRSKSSRTTTGRSSSTSTTPARSAPPGGPHRRCRCSWPTTRAHSSVSSSSTPARRRSNATPRRSPSTTRRRDSSTARRQRRPNSSPTTSRSC